MPIFLRKKNIHWNRKDKNSFICILPLLSFMADLIVASTL